MISEALLNAQKLLHQKRAEARRLRVEQGRPVDLHKDPAKQKTLQSNIQNLLQQEDVKPPTLAEIVEKQAAQPSGALGWHNPAITQLIRNRMAAANEPINVEQAVLPWPTQMVEENEKAQPTQSPKTVKIYPSLATAILRQEQSAAARLYYLCRAIDTHGRGCLHIDEIKKKLTLEESEFRIGKKKTDAKHVWRNVRGLLNRGEGIFWTRDYQDRIWLYGAGRIALNLECDALYGEPTAVPLNILREGIQQFRAYLYASFHCGREKQNKQGRGVDRPISQISLQEVMAVSGRTQTRYNRVAKIRVRTNYTFCGRDRDDQLKEQLYVKAGNAFSFKDYKGRHGERGATYVASRLPNSYHTSLMHMARGRHSKINDYLSEIDLVTNVGEEGAEAEVSASSLLTPQGNGRDIDDRELFYQDPKKAGRAADQERDIDHFFISIVRSRKRQCSFWYQLPARIEGDFA